MEATLCMLEIKPVNGEANYQRKNWTKSTILPKMQKVKRRLCTSKKKKKVLEKKTMKLKQGMKEKGKKEKRDTEENKRLLRTSGQVALSTKTSDLVSNIYL